MGHARARFLSHGRLFNFFCIYTAEFIVEFHHSFVLRTNYRYVNSTLNSKHKLKHIGVDLLTSLQVRFTQRELFGKHAH